MRKHQHRFAKGKTLDKRGAAIAEYAVLVGLVSLVCWSALSTLSDTTNSLIASIATCHHTQATETVTPKGIVGIIAKSFGSTKGLANECTGSAGGVGSDK